MPLRQAPPRRPVAACLLAALVRDRFFLREIEARFPFPARFYARALYTPPPTSGSVLVQSTEGTFEYAIPEVVIPSCKGL